VTQRIRHPLPEGLNTYAVIGWCLDNDIPVLLGYRRFVLYSRRKWMRMLFATDATVEGMFLIVRESDFPLVRLRW
jgi:hypothetical protein